MSSSDSSCIETTYTQDLRIEKGLKLLREEEYINRAEEQQIREQVFYETFSKKLDPIFQCAGLYFQYFNHKKIKFCYKPSDLVKYVQKNVAFYCKLVYSTRYQWWRIKRDSFPANCKIKIYRLFYQDFYATDEEIMAIIAKIYRILLIWSKMETQYRLDKFKRYQRGELEDLDMDSDDIVLFFSERKRAELEAKRSEILKRMVPPIRKRKRIRRIEIFSSSSTSSTSESVNS